MTDHSELIQNTVNEFRRFAKRTLVPLVEQLEHTPDPNLFRKAFEEVLGFGWVETEEMARDDQSASDALLSELFFALGEETLAGSLGIGLIAHLLPNRLLDSVKRGDLHCTYPLFVEREQGIGGAHRPDFFPLVPLVGWAQEFCWPAGPDRLIRLSLGKSPVTQAGPIRTLGLRGCPLYDVRIEQGHGGNEAETTPVSPMAMKAAMESARKWTLALTAGIYSGGLNRAVVYASERYQGGDLIIRHSGLRTVISKLQAALASAELTFRHDLPVPRAAEGEERGSFLPLFAEAMESLAEESQFIIQIFGGYGYMEDFTVERVYRDVTTLAVAFGRRGFDRVQPPHAA